MEYVFRHSLMTQRQPTARSCCAGGSSSIDVGEAIETLFGERLEEFYPGAGAPLSPRRRPALHYFTLAGDTAFGLMRLPNA